MTTYLTVLIDEYVSGFNATRTKNKGPTPANLRADAVVIRRRANWPHLSQEVPQSKSRFLPKFRKGGGQQEWRDGRLVLA